ncbi:hypothetical protein [Treponema sp. OMZ 855]|uniref:hypothetical protein n=1 Tax=Treponema sp. OMZ 855 TaxID=1643512 RepID=UPI0020A2E1A2|nr:hypothetical protein [Treponema sp. OMZ 855]UTC51007.1 hypothetical protein E4N65_01280 [Treponema sp. OMZ 855]
MAYTNEALGKALEDLTAAYNNFITKAKEAAIAAIGNTVIAQVKQDAKEYIASELAAQKNKLEKAIETAKIALHNSAIEADTTLKQAAETKKQELASLITAAENTIETKLTLANQQINDKIQKTVQEQFEAAADTTVKAKINTAINETLIKIFQNGYIQRPGMKSPLEDTALHFEGYSWYEVNYDGNFFRAKGRNAKAFSSKKLTIEQIRNGDYIFQDDEQEDAVRNIKGSFKKGQGGYESFDYTGCSGVFQASDNHRTNDTATGVTVSRYDNTKQIIFDTSKDPNLKTAEENRSRNLTFTIWALVKDE